MNSVRTSSHEDSQVDWLAESRPDMDERYRAARRHSLRVRILKIALPLFAVLGAVGFIGYVYVLPQLPANVAFGSIDISGNAIVMQDPHVSGFMSGGRAYELRADRAEQSLKNTKIVTLQNIGATIGLGDDQTAKVKAASGTYYADSERMVLDDQITLSTTTGIDGSLASADIDMKSGTMRSDKPLEISSQGSTIKANNVEVQDRGKRISFRNGVKVTYALPDESDPSKKRAASPVTE
ncbi:LPS export ABC transporter periplasmic protein LptC [Kaistia dalseonensis]|uniref:Lipopolysaccharide export system protein LptC n=1 Tax=Kaistia dalseonensis TaxID=410840 RepID=A0ABU0H6C5_9HYPH|nr:LPS export ABC transporter periplasmic protein LptC [Kaistia dalseonensis]MCX5494996.1 LPS export ABC transporter periplasmic protein LptC [Kaistia dalseonensis]MDQ0437577.1 lipopolysaccharide export system protein LptC [Kaistia dalseonensis]